MPKGFESDDERASKPRPRTLSEREGVPDRTLEVDSDGTPIATDPETTDPFDIVLRDPTEREAELATVIAGVIGVPSESPLAAAIAKAFVRVGDVKEDGAKVRKAADTAADGAMAVAAAKTPSLERLAAVERQIKTARWAIGVVATAALGSALTVAKGLYERGADDGALRQRIEHQDRDIDRLRLEIRDLRRERRGSSSAPSQPKQSHTTWFVDPTKGPSL